jgi:4-hydroxy-3-polyprenylbenzoate decarboxylase
MDSKWIIGVTGASGIRYALRLIQVLGGAKIEQHIVFSDAALRVMLDEEGESVSHANLADFISSRTGAVTRCYNPRDIGAAIASGSFIVRGMVVCPCSMGTLGALAHGLSHNLVHRAADVTLKEGRKLILVPRETPLSAIHLENMLKLAQYGAAIVPAMPGFYHRPNSLEEIIDMQVMKILDQMEIRVDLVKRWEGKPPLRKSPDSEV